MVGITLSAEQIRKAPPEVRRWLEQELLISFGLQPPSAEAGSIQLTSLSVEDAAKVLSLIQGIIPAVNVFFELGREGASVGMPGIEAFRLVDILRHTRLQSVDQVVNCLDTINQALSRVRGEGVASFYELDDQGFCVITAETQRSILRIWHQLVVERELERPASPIGQLGEPSAGPVFRQPGERTPASPADVYFDPPLRRSVSTQELAGNAATRVDGGTNPPGALFR